MKPYVGVRRTKPRVLAWVPLCDYERWSALHALTALSAVDTSGVDLDICLDIQTRASEWREIERFAGRGLLWGYWWRDGIAAGPEQHRRLAGITHSRNRALRNVRNLLDHFDGLWFVDSDVLVPPDALVRLWALDRPLTSGVFHSTDAGRIPYVFMRDLARAERRDAPASADYDCHYVRWLPDEGRIDVDFVGNGCLLWRGAALASGLTYRYGWREADGRHWAEDPFCLLDALDLGLGPVRVDCGLRCLHTHPGGLAYGQHGAIPTVEALRAYEREVVAP